MVEPVNKEEIVKEIDEIKASLPEHSIPPAMLLRLEELEDILEGLLEESGENDAAA